MNRFCVIVFLIFLAACSGGSGRTSLPSVPTASQDAEARSSLSEAASDILTKPQPTYTPGANDLLYVGNAGNNSITVYHHNANYDTAPLYTIAGSNTKITSPGQLSEDSAGNLYVANNSTSLSGLGSVLVFAHGAKGNVAPIRVLTGSKTQIQTVLGVTVDKTTGKLFVESSISPSYGPWNPNITLLRFPPNSTGNATPFASGPFAQSYSPGGIQIDSDSTGQNIIAWVAIPEAEYYPCCQSITAVAKQFANNNQPAQPYTFSNIAGMNGYPGIADDPTTETYLVSGQYQTCTGSGSSPPSTTTVTGIIRFAEGVSGDAYYGDAQECKENLKPVLSILKDTCAGQLAIGYLRNIYVVHDGCPTDAIYVYTQDSSGNAKPLRILSGSATKLDGPVGIYEGQ